MIDDPPPKPSWSGYGRLHAYSGRSRYLEDPMARAELFTKAQVLLTAFVLGLEPLNSDPTIAASPRAGLRHIVAFDA